jgi:hypothetical protein
VRHGDGSHRNACETPLVAFAAYLCPPMKVPCVYVNDICLAEPISRMLTYFGCRYKRTELSDISAQQEIAFLLAIPV